MAEHRRRGASSLAWLQRSDAVGRVVRTFVLSFLGLLIPGVLGWLHDLTTWAQTEGQAPLPEASSLAYLGVAAISASSVAAVNAVVVIIEDTTGRALLRTPRQDRPRRAKGGDR